MSHWPASASRSGVIGRELDRVGHHGGEPLAALVVGKRAQHLVALGQQVERHERGRRLLPQPLHSRGGRVDALREQVELLDAVHHHDHLAVEHQPLVRQLEHLLHDVREVAVHRPAVAALELDVVAVAEHDRPEAVELGLVAPALALGQLLAELRELRLQRRLQRQTSSRRDAPSEDAPAA